MDCKGIDRKWRWRSCEDKLWKENNWGLYGNEEGKYLEKIW